MTEHRERGTVLMQQGRLEQAVAEFRNALGEDPDDAVSHGCMALCLTDLEKLDEAERAATEAVRKGPDLDIGHYALGFIHLRRNRFQEAQRAAAEAIRVDPEDCSNFALMARVWLAQRNWAYARDAAEAGLAIDAEHVDCLNLRARALSELGQKDEARRTLEAALARDPDSGDTHATAGWTALRDGDSRRALEHFKEALRLDPTLDHARAGIVEALKSRNFVYALMLKYFFWMGRLSRTAQWGVVIGGYVAFRILRTTARKNPDLAPWLWPLLGLYLLWVFLTWTADPISNLVLRLHPYGRLALSREQITASNVLGGVLLGALGGLGWWLATDDPAALAASVGCLFLCLPVAAIFSCQAGWPRRLVSVYSVALAAVGIAGLLLWLAGPSRDAPGAASTTLLLAFIIGAIASSWIANALVGVMPKR